MSSKPSLPVAAKTLLLLLLLFGTGASLPLNALKQVTQQNQGATGPFLSLVFDLLQHPDVLSNLYQHSDASTNILNYFEQQPNADDSLFWVNNRAGLLQLLSDSSTLKILGSAPWLFHILRLLNQTFPQTYGSMLSNRLLLNGILYLIASHAEFRSLLSYHPEYLPLVYNLTLSSPRNGSWIHIFFPPSGAVLNLTTLVVVMTLSPLIAIKGISIQLLAQNGTIIQSFSSSSLVVFNATLNTKGIPEGIYRIQASATLADGTSLTDSVGVYAVAGPIIGHIGNREPR